MFKWSWVTVAARVTRSAARPGFHVVSLLLVVMHVVGFAAWLRD